MINNLRTTKCTVCGEEINGKKIKPPFIKSATLGIENIRKYYGGKVDKFITAICCDTEYIAMLHAEGNSYRVIDLAYKELPGDADIEEAVPSTVANEAEPLPSAVLEREEPPPPEPTQPNGGEIRKMNMRDLTEYAKEIGIKPLFGGSKSQLLMLVLDKRGMR